MDVEMCRRQGGVETHSLPAFASRYPSRFTLITRSPRRPCASYPSCVAVYPRDFETHLVPSALAATHRGFAFYVAFPKRSIRSRRVLCRRSISSIVFRSLPLGSTAIHRGFTGHFADPVSSIHSIAGAARHSPQRVNSGQALTAEPYRTELMHRKPLTMHDWMLRVESVKTSVGATLLYGVERRSRCGAFRSGLAGRVLIPSALFDAIASDLKEVMLARTARM